MKLNEEKSAAQWNEGSERRPKGPNAPRQAKEANKTILHFLAVAGKAKEMKSCVCCCGGVWFVLLFLFVVGYRRLAAIMLRNKEDEQKDKTNSIHELLFLFQYSLSSLLLFLFRLGWAPAEKREEEGRGSRSGD